MFGKGIEDEKSYTHTKHDHLLLQIIAYSHFLPLPCGYVRASANSRGFRVPLTKWLPKERNFHNTELPSSFPINERGRQPQN